MRFVSRRFVQVSTNSRIFLARGNPALGFPIVRTREHPSARAIGELRSRRPHAQDELYTNQSLLHHHVRRIAYDGHTKRSDNAIENSQARLALRREQFAFVLIQPQAWWEGIC